MLFLERLDQTIKDRIFDEGSLRSPHTIPTIPLSCSLSIFDVVFFHSSILEWRGIRSLEERILQEGGEGGKGGGGEGGGM